MSERYLVVSSDCHAGNELHAYRDYLPSALHDEFDRWVDGYEIPFEDLKAPEADRNWSSARRIEELDADGIAAEVLYPNTIPPFFPRSSLVSQPTPPTKADYALRWEGLKAHNRWLVDFCAEAPGRRAGICQIMLHDVDAAVAEVRWAKEAGLTGGVLLPGAPPGSGVEPLWSSVYEPLWSVCEELGMPLNHHSGSAVPYFGDDELAPVMFILEITWWANRALWHLVFSGVLERHPDLQLVFTEQGTAWVPERLRMLDHFWMRMRDESLSAMEAEWGGPARRLSLSPSEYWARQCHVGCSFLRPTEAQLRYEVGVDKLMWGSDYPHRESTYPYSREALRATFAGMDPSEVAQIVGLNAARLYGFDVDQLRTVADRIGPTHDEIAVPLDEVPPGADSCPAFAEKKMLLAAAR